MTSHRRHTGIIAWFAYNPVAANLLMATILLVGGMTLMDIRTEGFPDRPPSVVTVTVDFEGDSPESVEEGAAIKVEEALDGIAGTRKITSAVTSSQAVVSVHGKDGYPIEKLKDEVSGRVDAISTFPEQVERVVVKEAKKEHHIIFVQLSGETDHRTLKRTAKRVRDRLLALPSVNKVVMEGARAYQVSIEVQEEKLREYGLSFDEVAQAVQRTSVNLSAGTLKTSAGSIRLQSRKQIYHGNKFNDVVVRSSADGGLVRIGDIASVQDGFTEQAVLSTFQGQPSIRLDVRHVGRESVVSASSDVAAAVEALRSENWLPASVQVSTWSDEAENINDSLSLLSKNAMIGMVLVLVLLALFLDLKVAFWVAVGIPVSFAGTFFVMGPQFLDYSINDLTIFASIIALGIVVDDAIIIGESICTYKEKLGNGVESAILGAKAVAIPATLGVLTTVAAFFPLTTITGDLGGGGIFRIIGVVTIICLLFSLVESKLILPAHLANLEVGRNPGGQVGFLSRTWQKVQGATDAALNSFVKTVYLPTATAMMHHRYQSLALFGSVLILTSGLVGGGIVKVSFFGDDNDNQIYAKVKMLPGTAASKTHDVALLIRDDVAAVNALLIGKYSLARAPITRTSIMSTKDEEATVIAQLLPGSERPFNSQEVVSYLRDRLAPLPDVEAVDFFVDDWDNEDLIIEISSNDASILADAARVLAKALGAYPGIENIKTTADKGTTELLVELKQEAQAFGLSNLDVIGQLRNAIFGFEAQRIQRDDEEVRVKVRYPPAERNSESDLQRVRIRTDNGGNIPLLQVAEVRRTKQPAEINRIDGKRVLSVTAGIDEDALSSTDLAKILHEQVFPKARERFPGLAITLSGDSEREDEATEKLSAGFVLGLLLVYALLAIPLKSYTDPFVIMCAIPFGIVGAILGHLIMDIPFSLLSFFGILALTGVVVNDSLILVSRYKQVREMGKPYVDAMAEAGRSRFRAVFLTSITAFVGLFPLILEKSEQAQELIPMAVSLAFGILFSTIITLLVVPVLIGVQHDIMAYTGRALKPA